MKFSKIITIVGTRPEAIKMAPVILELQKREGIQVIIVATSQHREMLDQVLNLFGIVPDYDLNIMEKDQTLSQIVERTMGRISKLFSAIRPDIILVQGDTTTAYVCALAGFYQNIPIAHIEAGLRTWNKQSPFPEEANRRMISAVADFHFAPTQGNKNNLIKDHVDPNSIIVTGNTVIDALYHTLQHGSSNSFVERFNSATRKLILVTAHRRENFGQPINTICYALKNIAEHHKDVEIVYPVHPNSNIQKPVRSILGGIERIHLLEPLSYQDFCSIMSKAYLVLTDSGGIQEEAPSLGIPVLVMRKETERPEAVEAGTVAVVGTEMEAIIAKTNELLCDKEAYDKMARAVNPYGDGKAAARIADFLMCSRAGKG